MSIKKTRSYLCDECGIKIEYFITDEDRDNPDKAPLCETCGAKTRYVFDFSGNIYLQPDINRKGPYI